MMAYTAIDNAKEDEAYPARPPLFRVPPQKPLFMFLYELGLRAMGGFFNSRRWNSGRG
jgi:hypothetical protein